MDIVLIVVAVMGGLVLALQVALLLRRPHRRGGVVADQDVGQRRRADHEAEGQRQEVQAGAVPLGGGVAGKGLGVVLDRLRLVLGFLQVPLPALPAGGVAALDLRG